MFRMLQSISLIFLLPITTHAGDIFSEVSVGIVKSEQSGIQFSTTKESLDGDIISICSLKDALCKSYEGSEFSIMTVDDSVEDVATGKNIYTFGYNDKQTDKLNSGTYLSFIYPEKVKADFSFNGGNEITFKSNDVRQDFYSCTSSEGVHVYSGNRNLHLYYSLGYDVKPTCAEDVYK
ncbi:hypothetical protein WH357_18670 [Enterobacter ludwigii]